MTNVKFDRLYESSLFNIQIGNNINYLVQSNYLSFLEINFDKIFDNKEISFEYAFKNLKKLKLLESYFFIKIEIKFLPTKIEVNLNNRQVIDIQYIKNKVDDSIDKIVKEETKRHKKFIEQKITEKE